MAKGRPADPTRARRGTGNRPVAGDLVPAAAVEPVVDEAPTFAVPATLPPEGREMFERIVEELSPRGLKPVDLEALEIMCHSAYAHRKAREFVAKHGVMVQAGGRIMPNPALKVARDEAAAYMRIAQEYGLTLAARLRLGLMQLAGESMLASLSRDLDRPDVEVRVTV
jgi:P27 family predicted phage terminase small subunit